MGVPASLMGNMASQGMLGNMAGQGIMGSMPGSLMGEMSPMGMGSGMNMNPGMLEGMGGMSGMSSMSGMGGMSSMGMLGQMSGQIPDLMMSNVNVSIVIVHDYVVSETTNESLCLTFLLAPNKTLEGYVHPKT